MKEGGRKGYIHPASCANPRQEYCVRMIAVISNFSSFFKYLFAPSVDLSQHACHCMGVLCHHKSHSLILIVRPATICAACT